jgi:hypothetical protein
MGQAFFRHIGAHSQIGSTQLNQVNGIGKNIQNNNKTKRLCLGQNSLPFKLARPLRSDVPVTFRVGRAGGTAADQCSSLRRSPSRSVSTVAAEKSPKALFNDGL